MEDLIIQKLAKERSHLLWYVDHPENASKSLIVESFLNYGDWDDVQDMIDVIGKKETARIFDEQISKKRVNYSDRTKQYFKRYFAKCA